MKVLGIAAAVVALVIVGFVVVGNPFGASVSERVASEVDAEVKSCRDAGLEEVAGEREKVYTCTYAETEGTASGAYKQYTSSCFAVIDGRAYTVSVDPC